MNWSRVWIKIGNLHAKDSRQDRQFRIQHPSPSQFDIGDNVPGDVPTGELALSREGCLGPAAFLSEGTDAWPDDVDVRGLQYVLVSTLDSTVFSLSLCVSTYAFAIRSF